MRFSTLAGAAMAVAPVFGRELPKDEERAASELLSVQLAPKKNLD